MKKKLVFTPNNPTPLAFAGIASAVALYMNSAGIISFLSMLGCIGIIFGIYFWHNYCYRIEIDDKGIEGPGRYGTMVRLHIPWNAASVSVKNDKRGMTFLMIRHRENQRTIKIAEKKFSVRTLDELKGLLERHARMN